MAWRGRVNDPATLKMASQLRRRRSWTISIAGPTMKECPNVLQAHDSAADGTWHGLWDKKALSSRRNAARALVLDNARSEIVSMELPSSNSVGRDVAIAIVIAIGIAIATAGAIEVMTHLVGPRLLTHYDGFPALAATPKRATNARGAPADPLNVALVGTEAEVREAFRRAGWSEADPVTHATSVKIAESVLLRRPDSTAPVSPLYLYRRMQDLAFEREVGRSASRRHHVRLWQLGNLQYEQRPVWLGGATFDKSAGISHRGLHPTHHIAPDVDEERDTLVANLVRAEQVAAMFRVTGVGVRVDAHNAEGDRFDTDGETRVLVLSPGNAPHAAPTEAPLPFAVRIKDRIWAWFHRR